MILTIDIGNTNIVMGAFIRISCSSWSVFPPEQDPRPWNMRPSSREMLDLHEITPAQIRGWHHFLRGSFRDQHGSGGC